LNWNVAFNTTFIDQKIAGLGITVPSFQGYATGGMLEENNIQINSVGYAPNSFFVYEQLYDADQRPIQGAYVDNADGKIDTGDRYRFHKAAPDYTFGLFSTLNYKSLTLQ
jgi:iron complex outermembrane receptor protein